MNKIIIIDDDSMNNFICQEVIKKVVPAVKLEVFTNPIEALSSLTQSGIDTNDIILLDINMPNMDGWQLLKELEKENISCDVIILTSSINLLDQENATKHPMIRLLVRKPLTIEKLENILKISE